MKTRIKVIPETNTTYAAYIAQYRWLGFWWMVDGCHYKLMEHAEESIDRFIKCKNETRYIIYPDLLQDNKWPRDIVTPKMPPCKPLPPEGEVRLEGTRSRPKPPPPPPPRRLKSWL